MNITRSLLIAGSFLVALTLFAPAISAQMQVMQPPTEADRFTVHLVRYRDASLDTPSAEGWATWAP